MLLTCRFVGCEVRHFRSASEQVFNHYHATYTLFNPTSTTKMISSANGATCCYHSKPQKKNLFAVYSALRTPANSCTDCSEICTEGEPSPAVWDTVIGVGVVVVVEPSGGCRRSITLVVCEVKPTRGYAARKGPISVTSHTQTYDTQASEAGSYSMVCSGGKET
jgi:hypothetical protein